MKSHVQTSFLNRAGFWTQLLPPTPGLAPGFLGVFRLIGLLRPNSIQSRWTRLRFTDQPLRSSITWTRRYPNRGWRRARRLISRTRGGSSDRRFRSYLKVDRDRPITRPALLCEISYRSARYPATARCWSGVTPFFWRHPGASVYPGAARPRAA